MNTNFLKNVTLTATIAGSLLAAMSCANQSDKNLYSRIPRVKTDKPVTGPARLNLEEISLDFPESTLSSGRSYSGITPSGNIYYFDSYTCDMYEFGPDGTLVSKGMGYGRGPQESLVKHCDCFAMSDEGEIALFGSSLDFEYFSKDRKVANRFWIHKEGDHTSPDDYLSYCEQLHDNVTRLHDGKMYHGLSSDNPDFSYFFTNDQFIKDSYRVGVIDMTTGEALPPIIKGFPEIYESDPFKYTVFDGVAFDFDKDGNIYLGFQADSMIYVFNKDLKPEKAFGAAGSDMDISYYRIQTMEDTKYFEPNVTTKGFYSWIEYIDETGICFRSYKKGSHSQYDGLQIYKDGRLIADTEVPKGLNVTGYSAPYYYSQVFDANDRFLVYRFRLD